MEEFIFDDDAEDVGAEVEAHCPKCRADTTHVVVSKYEDEIRKVQCNSCGDVHAYRKPKGEDEEDPTPATAKKKQKAKPTYDQALAKWKKPPRTYAINEYFKELEVIQHPKFGVGFVSENIGEDKIEVTFKEDKRVLIHNRKNLSLPFLRPLNPPAAKGQKAAAGKDKDKEKAGKGKAAAEPPVTTAAAPAKAAAQGGGQAAPAAKKAAPANTKASAAARPAAKRPVEAKAAAKPAKSEKPEKSDKKAAAVKIGKAAAASSAKKKAAGAKAKPAGRTAAHVAAKKPAAKAKPVKKLSKKSR
jgi:Zn ribbon nucleic-acid-binding protein